MQPELMPIMIVAYLSFSTAKVSGSLLKQPSALLGGPGDSVSRFYISRAVMGVTPFTVLITLRMTYLGFRVSFFTKLPGSSDLNFVSPHPQIRTSTLAL